MPGGSWYFHLQFARNEEEEAAIVCHTWDETAGKPFLYMFITKFVQAEDEILVALSSDYAAKMELPSRYAICEGESGPSVADKVDTIMNGINGSHVDLTPFVTLTERQMVAHETGGNLEGQGVKLKYNESGVEKSNIEVDSQNDAKVNGCNKRKCAVKLLDGNRNGMQSTGGTPTACSAPVRNGKICQAKDTPQNEINGEPAHKHCRLSTSNGRLFRPIKPSLRGLQSYPATYPSFAGPGYASNSSFRLRPYGFSQRIEPSSYRLGCQAPFELPMGAQFRRPWMAAHEQGTDTHKQNPFSIYGLANGIPSVPLTRPNGLARMENSESQHTASHTNLQSKANQIYNLKTECDSNVPSVKPTTPDSPCGSQSSTHSAGSEIIVDISPESNNQQSSPTDINNAIVCLQQVGRTESNEGECSEDNNINTEPECGIPGTDITVQKVGDLKQLIGDHGSTDKSFTIDRSSLMSVDNAPQMDNGVATDASECSYECLIGEPNSTNSGYQNGQSPVGNKRGACELPYQLPVINGKLAYKCIICNKEFGQLSNLKAHLRIHTGERPYKCSFCSKSFTQLAHKQKHELIHTGQKPFICEACNKGFTSSSNLKSHQKCHLNEETIFQCNQCNKQYRTLFHMQVHRESHKSGRCYICPICNKKCMSTEQLAHHWINENCLDNSEVELCTSILYGKDLERQTQENPRDTQYFVSSDPPVVVPQLSNTPGKTTKTGEAPHTNHFMPPVDSSQFVTRNQTASISQQSGLKAPNSVIQPMSTHLNSTLIQDLQSAFNPRPWSMHGNRCAYQGPNLMSIPFLGLNNAANRFRRHINLQDMVFRAYSPFGNSPYEGLANPRNFIQSTPPTTSGIARANTRNGIATCALNTKGIASVTSTQSMGNTGTESVTNNPSVGNNGAGGNKINHDLDEAVKQNDRNVKVAKSESMMTGTKSESVRQPDEDVNVEVANRSKSDGAQ